MSVSAEHFQVQIWERHPPGWAPQAGVVRRQAGQLHLLHLQRQGHGRPALPGVIAQGKPLHLCPLTARTHAPGQFTLRPLENSSYIYFAGSWNAKLYE